MSFANFWAREGCVVADLGGVRRVVAELREECTTL